MFQRAAAYFSSRAAFVLLLFTVTFLAPFQSAFAQQVNAVTNGTFENGSTGWTTSGNFYADTRFQKYHNSPGYAYLSNSDGSAGNNLSGYVRQTVSVPAGATNVQLKFWYWVTTSDTLTAVKDVMNLSLTDTATGQFKLIADINNTDSYSNYAAFTWDISSYAGKQFLLQFYAQTDGAGPTVFRVDDVSVTYTVPVAPKAPSNLQVVGNTGRILLSWQDTATNESNFEVERKSLNGSYSKIATINANTVAYEDSQSNGNTRCYRVRATNSSGSSAYSNEACGTSLAPPSLSSPDNDASLNATTVNLSWQSVTGANAYGVDVGKTCGGTQVHNNVGTTNLNYSVTVSAGTYFWRVRAANTTYPGVSDASPCRTFKVTTTPAPVASFTWTPQAPKAGDNVSFTDTSTGNPTSWTWNFGDNQTSTARNPSHIYTTAGTYTVTLTVTNSGGSNTTSRQINVSVAPPTVDFTFSPTSPTTSTPVTFTQQTSGGATTFAWDFNDGSTGTGATVTHTFAVAKTYAVKLTATNGGGSASVTKNVVVGPAGQAPVANFSYAPTNPQVGEAVSFTDTSTGSPTSWSWSFGDNSTSTVKNPSHTFASAGTFTVTLTAGNGSGSNSTTRQVTVQPKVTAPTAAFTHSPENPKAGQPVSFTDASTGAPTSWLWNFGDGGTSTLQNPSHVFAAVGTFTVALTVSKGSASNSTTKQLTVSSTTGPSAEFTWSPVYPTVDAEVSFTDKSIGATSWNWAFADGSTSAARHPTHRFGSVGDYKVRLSITTSTGTLFVEHVVSVGKPPKPSISFEPASPRVKESITFRGVADAPVESWRWGFDDGVTATSQQTVHVFQTPGTHTVSLTASNRYGELTATVKVEVKDTLACAGCVTLSGVVSLGGVPLRANSDRIVHVNGPSGFSIDIVIDSAGGYRLDVPPGTYSLSAELRYTSTINGVPGRVTSDRVTVNVGTSDITKHISFDPPVIFVHGIRSDSSRWSAWAQRLAAAEPATVIIGVQYDYKADYSSAASVIRGQLDSVLRGLTPQLPSLRVIAHSKGGLVTRAVMGEYPEYGAVIDDIVLLGTPNLGVYCYTSGLPSVLASSYQLAPDQVRSSLSFNEAYDRMPMFANIRAIVGTENRADASFLDSVYSPCRDSCEANDGFVNWSSATTIEYVAGGSLRKRFVDAVAVPYSHADLGTSATNWVLDSIVLPYFYSKNQPLPSCTMTSSDCNLQCASGRGLTFRGACTIAPAQSTTFVSITWARPPVGSTPPMMVTATRGVGPSDCAVSGQPGAPMGYRIYRSPAGTIISPAGQPTSELIGYVSAGGNEFRDFSAPPEASYIVCAVWDGGVNACAQSVSVTPSRKRPSR